MEKIGALWTRVTKKREEYFSGVIGGKNVIIFKNTRKQTGDKYPDYEVFDPGQKDKLPLTKEDDKIPF